MVLPQKEKLSRALLTRQRRAICAHAFSQRSIQIQRHTCILGQKIAAAFSDGFMPFHLHLAAMVAMPFSTKDSLKHSEGNRQI
jgi:hypothetical protein